MENNLTNKLEAARDLLDVAVMMACSKEYDTAYRLAREVTIFLVGLEKKVTPKKGVLGGDD